MPSTSAVMPLASRIWEPERRRATRSGKPVRRTAEERRRLPVWRRAGREEVREPAKLFCVLRCARRWGVHSRADRCWIASGHRSEESDGEAACSAYAAFRGGDDDAREARWQWEAGEFAGSWRRGADAIEECFGGSMAAEWRGVEPCQV